MQGKHRVSALAAIRRKKKHAIDASINDHPDIRRVFDGFHVAHLNIRYSCTNQRQGMAEITVELAIMNWVLAALGGLFDGA